MFEARDPSRSLSAADALQRIIHRDPARRGLCGADGKPLCPGDLTAAARHLAEAAAAAAIVTGFYIPHGQPPAVETDGLTGSLFLARALHELGIEVCIISDAHGLPALEVGVELVELPRTALAEFPFDHEPAHVAARGEKAFSCPAREWVDEFFQRGPGRNITHVIAVERVGPSHTPASLAAQRRRTPAPLDQFSREVPPAAHDQCHNMAGRNITPHTAPTHLLFEWAERKVPAVTTIGVGDGGNEIGMGKIPWEELRRLVPAPHAGQTFCRIATDFTVVGGTSNWGAFALGAAVLAHRKRPQLLRAWDRDWEWRLMQALVERGPAVDGVTGRQQPTVDGLPFETYFQIVEAIREAVLSAAMP